MMRSLLASLAVLAILWAPLSASGRVRIGPGSSHAKAGDTKSTHKKSTAPRKSTHPASTRVRSTHAKLATPARKPATRTVAATAPRNARGRIQRNSHARHEFMIRTGYPHGRPGYVVDHVVPLACGGADAASNMQWQTMADAKVKDKIERLGCR